MVLHSNQNQINQIELILQTESSLAWLRFQTKLERKEELK